MQFANKKRKWLSTFLDLSEGIAINTTIRDGKTQTEIRYYILSRFISGHRFGVAVRTHWGIENRLPFEQAKRNLALAKATLTPTSAAFVAPL